MDLIDEVIKDIKDEKHYNAFKKALPMIIGITLMLVMVMVLKTWFANKNKQHNIEMGDILNNAIVLAISGQEAAANESFDYILKEAKNNVKDLAALSKAIQLLSHDKTKSMEALAAIADNKSFLDLTRSYSKLLWLTLAVDLPVNVVDAAKINLYLKDFNNEQHVFYGTANLLQALWLIKQNKENEAKEILVTIINSDYTNYTNKNNAQAVLANLSVPK